jgi:nicotinamide-nucleotide amidase
VVVTVGDELLFGQTEDTNGSWLARELSRVGLEVVGRRVVGDDGEQIREAVGWGLDFAEVVLVTGGLGPTPDDLTREAVAGLLGASLRLDPGLLRALERRFRDRGYGALPEGSKAMACVPEGGVVLRNPRGAAPGLALESEGGGLCVLLPGIPVEMKGIFKPGVEKLLESKFGSRLRKILHREIHTVGVPESILMSEIQEILPGGPEGVDLAYLPDHLGVRIRLSAREGDGPEGAPAALERAEALLNPVLARYRFEAESGDLAEAVGAVLLRRRETLAVAESCTGGLISKRMTDLPGSSQYFLGGIVAYDNRVKTGLLGIDESLIREVGVVSEAVADAMARGVARCLGASVGVGVTGVAGPGGGSREKPVGTVCYAVSYQGASIVRKELFLGDRGSVRERSAHAALGLVFRVLEGREG